MVYVQLERILEVLFQTNGLNHSAFEEWAKIWPDVQLICDGATSNEVNKSRTEQRVSDANCQTIVTIWCALLVSKGKNWRGRLYELGCQTPET